MAEAISESKQNPQTEVTNETKTQALEKDEALDKEFGLTIDQECAKYGIGFIKDSYVRMLEIAKTDVYLAEIGFAPDEIKLWKTPTNKLTKEGKVSQFRLVDKKFDGVEAKNARFKKWQDQNGIVKKPWYEEGAPAIVTETRKRFGND